MTTIGLIGDSHAKVVFRTMKKILPEAGFETVYIRAENGWGLKKHIKEGTIQQLKNAKPKIIIASLGGNNHVMDGDRYKKTVDTHLALAKSMGSKVVWVGPTTSSTTQAPSTEKRHAWTHNFLQQYLPSKGIDYISIRDFTQFGQRKDGVHYKSSFYKTWAQMVTKKLGQLKGKLESGPYRTPFIVAGIISLTTVLAAAGIKIARRNKGSAFLIGDRKGRSNKAKQAVKIAKHLDKQIEKLPYAPTGEKMYKARLNLPHDILDISNQPLPPGITSTDQSIQWNGVNPFNWAFAAPLDWGCEQYYLLDKSSGIVYVIASKHGYKYIRNGGGDDYENVWWKELSPEHRKYFAPVLNEYQLDGYKVYEMPYIKSQKTNFDFHQVLGDWSLGTILSHNGDPSDEGIYNGKPVIRLYGSSSYDLRDYIKEQRT